MTFALAAFAWLRSSWLGKALAFALAALAAIALIRRDAKQGALRENALKQKEKEHEITEDMGVARDLVRRDGVRKRLRDGEF